MGNVVPVPLLVAVSVRCQSLLSDVRTNSAANDDPAAIAGLSVAIPPAHWSGVTAIGSVPMVAAVR